MYIDHELADGRYTIREIECADGYILDTQPKTIYVEYGGCTTITWKNTAVTGQIQVTKTSADYNSMNGWPAGTPIPGTVFEIYHYRTGNLVDTIRTDKNGVAVSKPLPLGRYKVVESQAADFYGLDKTPIEVEIEHAGQIVKAAMTNKSLSTNVSIEKTGYAEVMSGQNIRYTFSNIANNSTTALTSFFWRDTLPVEAVRLAKVATGAYNAAGNCKIRAVNFRIDEDGDLVCPNNKKFHLLRTQPVKGNRYGRTEEIYQCEDCSGCPHKDLCSKSNGNRTVRLNEELTRFHQEVLDASIASMALCCVGTAPSRLRARPV